jgi:hypothetical protein
VARAVTLAELRSWARQLADVEGDPNITDGELTALANRHLPAVYDMLVDAGPPDYFAATTTLTTNPGQIPYSLPANFLNLAGVYAVEGDERRPLRAANPGTRGRYKAPQGSTTIEVEYIPAAPVLALDADSFDGVSGWEELIANLMARDVMIKRESDPSAVMATIAGLTGRINAAARNRDRGAPKRVTDTDEAFASSGPWDWPSASNVTTYRLRAGNLELFESQWVLP